MNELINSMIAEITAEGLFSADFIQENLFFRFNIKNLDDCINLNYYIVSKYLKHFSVEHNEDLRCTARLNKRFNLEQNCLEYIACLSCKIIKPEYAQIVFDYDLKHASNYYARYLEQDYKEFLHSHEVRKSKQALKSARGLKNA